MTAKEAVKLFKRVFKEAGFEDREFEKIENKCITMNHLGFPDVDVVERLKLEVKNYLDNVCIEKDRFNFVNIAETYDIDLSFLS